MGSGNTEPIDHPRPEAAGEEIPADPYEAWVTLHRACYRKLVALCVKLTHDRARGQDLAHDTLERAVRYRASHDSSREIWPWLATIAYNNHSDRQRSDAHEVPEANPCLRLSGEIVEDHADDVVDGHVLDQAMSRLTKKQAHALRLCYLHGWTQVDAAKMLGMSHAAFKQLVWRARSAFEDAYRDLTGGVGALVAPVWLAVVARLRLVGGRAQARVAPDAAWPSLPSLDPLAHGLLAVALTLTFSPLGSDVAAHAEAQPDAFAAADASSSPGSGPAASADPWDDLAAGYGDLDFGAPGAAPSTGRRVAGGDGEDDGDNGAVKRRRISADADQLPGRAPPGYADTDASMDDDHFEIRVDAKVDLPEPLTELVLDGPLLWMNCQRPLSDLLCATAGDLPVWEDDPDRA